MLPFLHPKKMSSVIMAKRKPDGSTEVLQEEGAPNPALLSAAEDLLSAISMKDAQKVALALEAAAEILKSSGSDESSMEMGDE